MDVVSRREHGRPGPWRSIAMPQLDSHDSKVPELPLPWRGAAVAVDAVDAGLPR